MEGCFKKITSSFIYPSSIHCPAPLIALHPFPLSVPFTLSCTSLHCPTPPLLSFTHLHCLAWLYTVLHPFTLSCTLYTVLHLFTLSCTPSHCLVLLHTVLDSLTLSCTPLYCSAPLYTPALPCSLYSALIPISMSHTLLCPHSSVVLLFNPLLPSVLLLYAQLTFILKYTHPCIHCKLRSTYDNELCFFVFLHLNQTLRSWFQRAFIS